MNTWRATLAVFAALMWLAAVSCSHPQVAVQAAAQTQAATGAATQAATGAATQAATLAQSDSSARVAVKRGARHFQAHVSVPLDGGTPDISFALDDDPDEITADATGAADAGASAAADAGAASAADAGAASSADAGVSVTVRPLPQGLRIAGIALAGLALLLGAVYWVLRKLGRWPL